MEGEYGWRVALVDSFFLQAEDGIRDIGVTGVQTCALPILAEGGGGLSVAFDMPTLMGRDSDDPRALGEVGHCGVAIDSAADMDVLFDGIDLAGTTTSMTISGPAVPVFCMYLVAAERQGAAVESLNGTLQTDIFKEYMAQTEWLFAPDPQLRLIVALMEQ